MQRPANKLLQLTTITGVLAWIVVNVVYILNRHVGDIPRAVYEDLVLNICITVGGFLVFQYAGLKRPGVAAASLQFGMVIKDLIFKKINTDEAIRRAHEIIVAAVRFDDELRKAHNKRVKEEKDAAANTEENKEADPPVGGFE
jgi:hypothetical protein